MCFACNITPNFANPKPKITTLQNSSINLFDLFPACVVCILATETCSVPHKIYPVILALYQLLSLRTIKFDFPKSRSCYINSLGTASRRIWLTDSPRFCLTNCSPCRCVLITLKFSHKLIIRNVISCTQHLSQSNSNTTSILFHETRTTQVMSVCPGDCRRLSG